MIKIITNIKTVEDSEVIKGMEKNYRILRRVHNEIYTSIAQNFQLYLNSLENLKKLTRILSAVVLIPSKM